MEEQREIVDEIPFPDSRPIFQRIEKVKEKSEKTKSDAEIFWEVTKIPENDIPPDVFDGNHPDNYEITTHDHVDQTIGRVPPTKRVKKILPPFEGSKLRAIRHIESSSPERLKTVERESSKLPVNIPSPQLSKTTLKLEVATTGDSENATEDSIDTPASLKPDDEIQGIRLVPNDFGVETSEEQNLRERGKEREEAEEEPTMQKSIWDLLKEREQFNSDSNHLDGLENTENETEVITRNPIEKTKSLYEHFDADSAEVEFETENFNRGSNIEKHELPISYALPWLQVKDKQFDVRKEPEINTGHDEIPQDVSELLKLTQNEKSVDGVSVSIINSGEGDFTRFGRRPNKWYLLLLTGNSTIVKLRRRDFTKYLKLNLAARLSVEYDDVKVNRVILAPPKVLVNVSVFAPSDDVAEESQLDFRVIDKGEAPLYKLAETNATLLELSGEEYHVIRFLSFETQKPEAEAHKDFPSTISMASRQSEVEFIIYTFLGSASACAVLLTFFVILSRYYKRVSDFLWFKPNQAAWKSQEDDERDKDEFEGVSPAVIYSGGFPQIRSSWMAGVGQSEVPTLRQQRRIAELGPSPPPFKTSVYSKLEDHTCASPGYSKLQIYNCDANSLVIPMPIRSKVLGLARNPKGTRNKRGDTHTLGVRILEEKTGQDNPTFTN